VEDNTSDDAAVTARGDGFEVAASAAVVAVPAPIAAELRFVPALPEDHAVALKELPMGVASKLAAATNEPPSPRAVQEIEVPFWCWAARGGAPEPRPVVAAVAGSPSAEDRLRTASGEPSRWMEKVRSMNPDVTFTGEVVMKTWADDPFARGSYSAFDSRSWDRVQILKRAEGRIAFAGEHTAAPHDYATMNGAVLSGLRAAEDVARIVG
jgi:monoamine oxidase